MDISKLRELTSATAAGSALQATLDKQSLSAKELKAARALATRSNLGFPGGIDYIDRMPATFKMPKMKNVWEVQSELFMEGLKTQVETLEASLKPNQELLMICWHGHEKFQVLEVSMPSKNVVALNCRDAEGDVTQVTGHMNSVTFSFRVVTAKEPVQRKRIGFAMPNAT